MAALASSCSPNCGPSPNCPATSIESRTARARLRRSHIASRTSSPPPCAKYLARLAPATERPQDRNRHIDGARNSRSGGHEYYAVMEALSLHSVQPGAGPAPGWSVGPDRVEAQCLIGTPRAGGRYYGVIPHGGWLLYGDACNTPRPCPADPGQADRVRKAVVQPSDGQKLRSAPGLLLPPSRSRKRRPGEASPDGRRRTPRPGRRPCRTPLPRRILR